MIVYEISTHGSPIPQVKSSFDKIIMGSKKKVQQKIEQTNHLKSRKTLAVIRDIKKINKRDKIKFGNATKVKKN